MYKTKDYTRNGVMYLNNMLRPRHKMLSTLMLYSTTKCQSRCKHCSIWQKPVEHLSFKDIREIMRSDAVEKRKRSSEQSLEAIIDTYKLIESIRSFQNKKNI